MTTSAIVIEATTPAVAAVVKTAPKKAPSKAKADAVVKTAAKAPAKGKATKGAPKAAIGIKFCLVNRPVSGGELYAFTQAVLNATGMLKGKGASKALLNTVMGPTAVRYHLNKTTFAADDKGQIVLTPVGVYSFNERVIKGQVDQSKVEAFEQLFRDGKANVNLPNAKNQVNIRAA